MKKLLGLKNINATFTDSINELFTDLQENLKEIKQEYQQNMIDEKIKFLLAICNGENLDFNEMKIKYLKPRELGNLNIDDSTRGSFSIDDNLLDKIRINDEDYYYESVNNGIVYNANNQPVGLYKNGAIVFNKC
jgi:hypothetical protein